MSQIARLIASCGLVVAVATGVHAETAKKSEKDAANKPALVASYGDWSVFQSQSGKSHICYTLAQPKERDPADLKRDPAYAFISERPAERVRNEVSFIMGFEVGAAPPPAEFEGQEKGGREGQEIEERSDLSDRGHRRCGVRTPAEGQ